MDRLTIGPQVANLPHNYLDMAVSHALDHGNASGDAAKPARTGFIYLDAILLDRVQAR
jgi:hypothetical protein